MARKPRIHYPGALYHVMLRGNGGADRWMVGLPRNTERPLRKHRDKCSGLTAKAVPQSHGGKSVVRGLLAMDHNSASLAEVARYYGRDVSSISNGVRQLRERSNEDKHFRQRITRLGERLMQIKTSKA